MTARLPSCSLSAAEVRDLLPLARGGDRDAADRLVRSLTPWVARQARRYAAKHPAADPDDLVQEGLLAVFRSIGYFDEARGLKARFTTYAMTAAVQQIARAAAKATVRRARLPAAEDGQACEPACPDPRPEGVARAVDAVRDVVDGLDPVDRAVVEAAWGLAGPATLARRAADLGITGRRARRMVSRAADLVRAHAAGRKLDLGIPPAPGAPRPGRAAELLARYARRAYRAAA